MIRHYLILTILGAGITACSSVSEIRVSSDQISIVDVQRENNIVDSIVEPYRIELADEMEQIIARSDHDFLKGRPNGSLNNWAADAVFQSQTRNVKLSLPAFCLLNVGGLRNPLNKGDITLGDIYKLMPFDNEIVWVEMPVGSLRDIESYFRTSGGEPISGAEMIQGSLVVNGVNEDTERILILTSDYLFNGGDRMDFFKQYKEVSLTGTLIRDVMISEARNQKTLIWDNGTRISLDE